MDSVIANVLPHGRAFFVLFAYPALRDVKYLLICRPLAEGCFLFYLARQIFPAPA